MGRNLRDLFEGYEWLDGRTTAEHTYAELEEEYRGLYDLIPTGMEGKVAFAKLTKRFTAANNIPLIVKAHMRNAAQTPSVGIITNYNSIAELGVVTGDTVDEMMLKWKALVREAQIDAIKTGKSFRDQLMDMLKKDCAIQE